MEATPTRAAAYRRISDANSAKTGYGLDSQAHQIAEYAAAHGYELVADYVDAGIAGDREDRPALLRLLAEVDQFEVVIVWDVSRLSRDLLLLGEITHALTEADVRIESVTNRIDLATPEGELQFNIGGSVAQYERKKIGQRVKAAAATRARSGKHHGPPTVRVLDALAKADPFIDALAVGDYLLVVEPRPESVAGLDEEWRPVLHREPIPMRDNTDGKGLMTHYSVASHQSRSGKNAGSPRSRRSSPRARS